MCIYVHILCAFFLAIQDNLNHKASESRLEVRYQGAASSWIQFCSRLEARMWGGCADRVQGGLMA